MASSSLDKVCNFAQGSSGSGVLGVVRNNHRRQVPYRAALVLGGYCVGWAGCSHPHVWLPVATGLFQEHEHRAGQAWSM